MITQSTLAEKLRLSQGTISLAFTPGSRINPRTRDRVLSAAKKMGYRPSSAARAMVQRRTRNLGVVIHSLGNAASGHHAYDTVSGINSIIEPAGYTTCLVQMADVEDGDDGVARVFREQALDGMIVHAGLVPHSRRRIDDLVERIVWCDAGVHQPELCLWRDEEEAGRLVARAVLDAGYAEAVFVQKTPNPSRPYGHATRRLAGVKEVLEASAVELSVTGFDPSDRTELSHFIQSLSPKRAVITCSYSHCDAIFPAAASMGRVAGHHFVLVSCDDRAPYEIGFPHLSRATFDRHAMGRAAAQMLLDSLEQSDALLPSQVIKPVWHDGALDPNGAIRPTLVPRNALKP